MTKEEFIQSITILVDSREQRNMHILQYLNEVGIKFKVQALLCGDYSFQVKDNTFIQECLVERKAHLLELAGNFSVGRNRFEKEFATASSWKAKVFLLIEDSKGKEKMILRSELDSDKECNQQVKFAKTWASNFSGNSMIGTLKSWKERYEFNVIFCDKKDSASQMIDAFYNYFISLKEA